MLACTITGTVAPNHDVVKTDFIYDEAQPFEIRLQSVTGAEVVFDRDLMAESFSKLGYVGIGWVRMAASSSMFFLQVRTGPEGWVKLAYRRDAVEPFLKQTFDLVPFGSEGLDVDALLDDFYNDKI